MVGDISFAENIYIICGKTDMRKSIDGLAAMVQSQYQLNPFTRSIFLFCGGKTDRIKILFWEGDGFVLIYKRLDVEQGRYRWPRNSQEAKQITWQQFDWLMSGLDIEQPKAIRSRTA